MRIFAASEEELTSAVIATLLLGIPTAIMLAIAPFWDHVGDLALVKTVNAYIAPTIDALPPGAHPASFSRFPFRRLLVASTSIIEIIFLTNFFALFARGVRKHALMVWLCVDRTKLFQYLVIACAITAACWYLLFCNTRLLVWLLTQHSGGRLAAYLVMGTPVVTFIFGHLASIVLLGAWRSGARELRRVRNAAVDWAIEDEGHGAAGQ